MTSNIFNRGPLSPTNPSVSRLIALAVERGGATDSDGDDKWAEKAVRSLAKKLRRSVLLDVLEQAIVQANKSSPCVPIPRSLDGRLQVSQRKCIPHVTYCRLWRWPDLQSQHHLKPVPNCQHPFSKKLDQAQVCVNPYHYERVEPSTIPPIVVPRAGATSQAPRGAKGDIDAKASAVPRARIEVTELSAGRLAAAMFGGKIGEQNEHGDPMGDINLLDEMNCNELKPLALEGLEIEDYLSEDADSTADQSSPPAANQTPGAESGQASPESDLDVDGVLVDFEEPAYWCTVTYYELKERVGEPFHATTSDFVVDGFCDPSSTERFCLGNLSNVSRQRVTTEVRKWIGAGARIYRSGAEVYAECLCESPLFVQSADTNRKFGLPPEQTLKLMPGCNLKIFDHMEFYRTLRQAVQQRKSVPQVTYCRLWRWPDLPSQQHLRSLAHCQFPYNRKLEQVCVNPYHYERVEPSSLPPIMVPKAVGAREQGNVITDEPMSTGAATALAAADAMVCSSGPESGLGSMSPTGLDSIDRPTAGQLWPGNAELADYLSEDADSTMDTNSPLGSPTDCDAAGCLDAIPVNYQEPMFWCMVSYYELNQRVGEPFHASQPQLIVDGYCDPSSAERFCLGTLSNVNRSSSVVEARKHIGHGARFYRLGDEVYCECLSDSAIFVQSANSNQRRGWTPATVVKILPGCTMKIFDYREFYRTLKISVTQGFEAAYSLTRMCTVRVSFVKGWGAEYRRQLVTATPCWVEMHLNGALQWLDRVISKMPYAHPQRTCTSNS